MNTKHQPKNKSLKSANPNNQRFRRHFLLIFYFSISTALISQNYSLQFDGVDDMVEAPHVELTNTPFTLEIWYKSNGVISNDQTTIIDNYGAGTSSPNSWHLFIYGISDGDMTGKVYFGHTGINVSSNNRIDDGIWHHIAVVRDDYGVLQLFIDGELNDTNILELGDNINTGYNLFIGSGHYNRYTECAISELRISKINLYSDSFTPTSFLTDENDLIYFDFNEGSGNILYDHSGNQNHGTIHGATWSSDVPTGCTDPLAINYNEEANFDDGSCEYIDSINLNFGNNLISFRGNPQNPNSQIIAESISNINFILGQGQGLFNTPEGWSGNLTTLDKYSGYWVNVSETQNWTYLLDGEPVDAETNPYNLSYGNNLISYLGQENCPTIDALGNENINFILGQGQGLFNTSEGWSGNLTTLNRGKGYWLNTGSSIEEFHWNTNCSDDGFAKNNYNLPEEFQFVQSTEQAFYLIKEIEEIENGDIITAYCGEQMVGSAIWNGQYTAIPVMGRDVSEQTLGFCESGEKPQFFWNKDPSTSSGGRRKEFGLALSPSKGDIPGFANLGVYTIDKLESVENEISPTEWSLAPAYPNPFNPVTTIEIGVPEIIKTQPVVSLQVFDINGRLIKTLIDGHIEPGFHTVDWDATGYPSGVYFVKMVAGDLSMNSGQGFTQSQKVILMK